MTTAFEAKLGPGTTALEPRPEADAAVRCLVMALADTRDPGGAR